MTRRRWIPAVKWPKDWCIFGCILALDSDYLCFQPYKFMLSIQSFLRFSKFWTSPQRFGARKQTTRRSDLTDCPLSKMKIVPGISKMAIPFFETVFKINGGVELTNSIFKLIWTSFAGPPSGVVTDSFVLNGISGLKLLDIFSSKAIKTGFRLMIHESLNSSSERPFSTVTLRQGSKNSLLSRSRIGTQLRRGSKSNWFKPWKQKNTQKTRFIEVLQKLRTYYKVIERDKFQNQSPNG